MKSKGTLILIGALVLGLLAGCGGGSEEAVTVQKVSRIVARGSVGLVNRYAGLTVSGESAEIKKDDKKIREVLVKEGDWVSEGDVLFRYDTEAMELDLSKLLLELDGLENTITTAEEEIPELEKQRGAAPAGQQLSFSLQIQTLQADIREATYNKGLKEREIAGLQEALEDTDVRAPLGGRVMSVQDLESGPATGYDEWGMGSGAGSGAFITIMDMSTYRIKGPINEMNVGTLMEGMPVIVRSRLDESVTWSGVISAIDWENKVTDQNMAYYYGPGGSDEMTASSKYPFYVELTDVTGLILGQHVYIEPDYGQLEVREGLWLPEYYICDAGENPWVWVANRHSRLEKRNVDLGGYDADTGEYRVLSGLTADDYIAFPEEELQPGMRTMTYEEAMAFASGGNAFYAGAVYVSGGSAYVSDGDAEEWEEPDESLFATEEELLALQEEEPVPEASPETEEGG